MTTHISQDLLEVEAARAKLRQARGPQFWRGLEELADTAEFRSLIEREFPQGAAEMADPVSRRTFMKLMGASLALAGLTGCTNWTVYMPPEKIAPYTKAPEGLVPGRKTYYASTATFGGYGAGVLVESHEGRPTKIEGNPQHPGSLGATDLFTQATILTMYDPDRSTQVLQNGQPSSWDAAVAALNSALQAELTPQGAGLRLLTETISSPTLVAQIQELLTAFPQARWVQYDPVNRDNVYAGAQQAFGTLVEPRYSFSRSTTAADGTKSTEILARVVVSLDADFLSPGAGFVPYARGFAKGRKVTDAVRAMNRLYVVEANMTSTGAAADHRLPTQASRVESVARALAQRLGVGDGPGSVTLTEAETRFVEAMVRDLEANRGASLVLAGYQQPPAVHALAHALNDQLGNVGATVDYIEPPVAQA
ncbi:MAG: TAT-variant-translocated molybdopterin oxidoreductase, partial [Chloroflexaceae bacterium]|nr:TAT-variant-translocated molybdopterin oxidoreductase [Chloroflexaceae bacterium]